MDVFSFISGLFGLILIGGILYLIFRPHEGQAQGKDAYYYIISFVLLLLLTWAVTDLLRIMLEQIWGTYGSTGIGYYGSNYSYNEQNLLRNVSLRLSTVVVALPIWAFHWYKASMKKKEEMDYHSRKSYATAVMILSSLTVIGMVTGLVYQIFNALLGIGQNANQAIPYLLPYAIAGSALWISHFGMWKKAKEEVEKN